MDEPTTARDYDVMNGGQPDKESAPASIPRSRRRRVMRNGAAVIAGLAAASYVQPSMWALGVPVSLAATSTVPFGLQKNEDTDAGRALTNLQTWIEGEPHHDMPSSSNNSWNGATSGGASGSSGGGGAGGSGGAGGGGKSANSQAVGDDEQLDSTSFTDARL